MPNLSKFPLCVCVAILASCGPGETKTEPEVEVDVALKHEPIVARIGAAGGELRAPAGHILEGVLVKIPEGALTAETELTLDSTIDETSLELLSERIGPQLKILPEGLALQKPATLTVPIDPTLLNGWGHKPSTCAVWQRQTTGWTKLVQTASTKTSVTVESLSLATVAAGIALNPAAFCAANPLKCNPVQPLAGTLCAGTFCSRKLPDLTQSMLDGTAEVITVSAGKLYYVHGSTGGRVAVARYDLETGSTSVFPSIVPPSGFVGVRGEIAIENDGTALLSTRGGNLAFHPSAATEAFEVAGVGVAVISGVSTRFFTKTVQVGKTTSLRLCASTGSCTNITSVNDIVGVKGRPGAIALSATAPKFALLQSKGLSAFSSLSVATTLPVTLGSGGIFAFGPLATSGVSNAAAANHFYDLEGATNAARFVDIPGTSTGSSTGLGLVFTSDDRLISFSGEDAKLDTFAADGTVTRVSLTSAQPGTPEFTRMLPRAITRVPGTDKLILVTRGLTPGSPEIYELRPGI